MLRHPTGQKPEVPRLWALPTIILFILASPVLAAPAQDGRAASPAAEPDTWLLLGSGALVLILLYTRRRARLRSISLRSARSRLKAAG